MKLTRERAIYLHRQMWDLLSRRPEMSKEKACRTVCPEERIDTNCFLCHYNNRVSGAGGARKTCDPCCELTGLPNTEACLDGLYFEWSVATTLLARSVRAARIRDVVSLYESTEYGEIGVGV